MCERGTRGIVEAAGEGSNKCGREGAYVGLPLFLRTDQSGKLRVDIGKLRLRCHVDFFGFVCLAFDTFIAERVVMNDP